MGSKEVCRVKGFVEHNPDLDIWIISKDKVSAKAYWNGLKQHIKINKKPFFILKENYHLDGCNYFNTVVLLCGIWYKNPIVFSDIFKMRIREVAAIFNIAEIPEPIIERNINNLTIDVNLKDTDIFKRMINILSALVDDEYTPYWIKAKIKSLVLDEFK